MPTTHISPTIIGLDGVERAWGEVFSGAMVANSELSGYVVRVTYFADRDGGQSRAHRDVATYGAADLYGVALDRVRAERDGNPDGYAVIDRLYSTASGIVRSAA